MSEPLRVGQQVQFREDAGHPQVLGVVTRIWPSGRTVTVVSDGRTFCRLIGRVTPCVPR